MAEASVKRKRPVVAKEVKEVVKEVVVEKRGRGRPPGSKNKPKDPNAPVPVKRGRGRPAGSKNKPKAPVAPVVSETMYDDFTKDEAVKVAVPVKRSRPKVAPSAFEAVPVKRTRPKVAPSAFQAVPVKRTRPKVAQVQIAMTPEEKKETRGMKKHVTTKEDLKKIGSSVVRAIKNVHIAVDRENKKREPEVIDMNRVLTEIAMDKGKTGYSLVDLAKEARRGAKEAEEAEE